MVSSNVLVMYYCKNEEDLDTTNDSGFCRTESFKVAAEAVKHTRIGAMDSRCYNWPIVSFGEADR